VTGHVRGFIYTERRERIERIHETSDGISRSWNLSGDTEAMVMQRVWYGTEQDGDILEVDR